MRASDLLGREVRSAAGDLVGRVIDLRATLDAPSSGVTPAPRVTALVLSRHHVGSYLGYQHPDQRGPWLVRAIVRRMHRHSATVQWTDVARHDGAHIVLRPGAPVT